MEVVYLKEDYTYLEQYVDLRNKYKALLLSSSVTVKHTKEWLSELNGEIRGLAEDGILLGVVILYLDKGGEITFFAKHKNRGIGSELLKIINEIAKERRLKYIFSWVAKDNLIAQRSFEKNGFIFDKIQEKEYHGKIKRGKKYVKIYQ